MNIVDSSCWLEYFKGSPAGDEVSPIIEDVEHLLVPAIILHEVFKKLLIELDENKALFALAQMRQGRVVDLDADLAIQAAKISKDSGCSCRKWSHSQLSSV